MEPRLFMLTPENARRLDQLAVERYGLATLCLMENAASGLAREVMRVRVPGSTARAVVVCGPGNNGGDGYAAARHLHNAGVPVTVVATNDHTEYTGDAAVNARIVRRMGLKIETGGAAAYARACAAIGGLRAGVVIVDAIFGTGLARPVDGVAAELIALINARPAGVRVVAADVPSGLDSAIGTILGRCIRADVTATFAGLKPGLVGANGLACCGRIVVVDIGVPRELVEELGTLYEAVVQ